MLLERDKVTVELGAPVGCNYSLQYCTLQYCAVPVPVPVRCLPVSYMYHLGTRTGTVPVLVVRGVQRVPVRYKVRTFRV